jgi:hypothetical protein
MDTWCYSVQLCGEFNLCKSVVNICILEASKNQHHGTKHKSSGRTGMGKNLFDSRSKGHA